MNVIYRHVKTVLQSGQFANFVTDFFLQKKGSLVSVFSFGHVSLLQNVRPSKLNRLFIVTAASKFDLLKVKRNWFHHLSLAVHLSSRCLIPS